jgi:hypothetical protein
MSVAEQFSGLDMKNLIGAPLSAAAESSVLLARSTADFINTVGFDADGKVRNVSFGYQKLEPNDDGTSELQGMKVEVPMLAIVPIPNLQIDEVNVLFDMEVKQSEKSENSTDIGASLSGSARFGPIRVSVSGSVSSHMSNTRSSDNSAKYHVDVRATNHGMPEGLSRVLDMMAVSISPVLVSTELKDGNGQQLTDKNKSRAEKNRQLRNKMQKLERQYEAAKQSLDSNIQQLRSISVSQQNAYQSDASEDIRKIKDNDPEREQKTEAINTAVETVSAAWSDFQNHAGDRVKMLADAGGDTAPAQVSGLFGLKAYSGGTAAEYDEKSSKYSQFLAAQTAAFNSQKQHDQAEKNYLQAQAAYNDAILGIDDDGDEASAGGGSAASGSAAAPATDGKKK